MGLKVAIEIPGPFLIFEYKNHRGEVAERHAVMLHLEHGATEWHPDPQWIMVAFDMDKGADRSFAMRDMSNVRVTYGKKVT